MRRILLLFLSLTLMVGCQTEDSVLQKQQTKLNFQKLSFSEAARISPSTIKKIDNVISNLSNNRSLSKTTDNNHYIVDSTTVGYLTTEQGYTSFTFSLKTLETQNKITNIIISNYKNGETKAFLGEYELKVNIDEIQENNIGDYINKTSFKSLDNATLSYARGGFEDEICIENGYYDLVDKCEGTNLSLGEKPECFDARGQRIQIEIFVVTASFCSGSGNGGGGTPPSTGTPLPPPPTDTGGGGGGPDTGYVPPADNTDPQPDPSNPGIVDANGNTIITSPLVPTSSAIIAFKDGLNYQQLDWWTSDINVDKVILFKNFLNNNTFKGNLNQEAAKHAMDLITQIIQTPLNYDIEASFKSPFNIDISAIDTTTTEGARFNEVYTELLKNPNFKALFTNIFDGPQTRLNVKFEIKEHVYHDDDPTSYEVGANIKPNDDNDNNYTIKVNKQTLVSEGTLYQNKLENAQTIAHEAIHAFLFNLLKNPNTIAAIQNIDQKNLKEILDALQSANPSQHTIMFNKLTTTLENILKSLKNVLTTPAQRAMVEDLMINQSLNQPHNPQIWNWDTYFKYLSYVGLDGTAGFKAQFPPNSDALHNFNLYITYGRAYLNLQI